MFVRRATEIGDFKFCSDLVMENWGFEPAQRCEGQFAETYGESDYAPVFCIADLSDPLSRGYAPMPIGFAAYQPSMKMKGSFDLIWIAVHRQYQAHGAGKVLTEWRINDIKKRGGQMIELVTQKPGYFSKFGFFKLHHLGNEWYLMLKLLAKVDI